MQLVPNDPVRGPLITVELKFAGGADASPETLDKLAEEALAQIASRSYDAAPGPAGALRWGIAFSGKSVGAVSVRVK